MDSQCWDCYSLSMAYVSPHRLMYQCGYVKMLGAPLRDRAYWVIGCTSLDRHYSDFYGNLISSQERISSQAKMLSGSPSHHTIISLLLPLWCSCRGLSSESGKAGITCSRTVAFGDFQPHIFSYSDGKQSHANVAWEHRVEPEFRIVLLA